MQNKYVQEVFEAKRNMLTLYQGIICLDDLATPGVRPPSPVYQYQRLRAVLRLRAGRRRRTLDLPSIQSLLSSEDDAELIDDEGDFNSDDSLDENDGDREYVFGGYSKSEESSDDEHEGLPDALQAPPRTLGPAASLHSSTSR